MIRSFRDEETARIFREEWSRKFQAVAGRALRKLIVLHRATSFADLRSPGNHLEALRGDRAGQHSIRINDQYRICFRWQDGEGAYEVEIVDYH